MAEKTDLDTQDRKNIYKEGATNVETIEMDSREINDFLEGERMPEELEEAISNMRQEVVNGGSRRAYVIIKVTL